MQDAWDQRMNAIEGWRQSLAGSGLFLGAVAHHPYRDLERVERELVMGAFNARRLIEFAGLPEDLEGQTWLVTRYPRVAVPDAKPLDKLIDVLYPVLGYNLAARDQVVMTSREFLNQFIHSRVLSIFNDAPWNPEADDRSVLSGVRFASDFKSDQEVYEISVGGVGHMYALISGVQQLPEYVRRKDE